MHRKPKAVIRPTLLMLMVTFALLLTGAASFAAGVAIADDAPIATHGCWTEIKSIGEPAERLCGDLTTAPESALDVMVQVPVDSLTPEQYATVQPIAASDPSDHCECFYLSADVMDRIMPQN